MIIKIFILCLLQLYLSLGMKLTKIHRVIQFKQGMINVNNNTKFLLIFISVSEPFIRDFIGQCTRRRAENPGKVWKAICKVVVRLNQILIWKLNNISITIHFSLYHALIMVKVLRMFETGNKKEVLEFDRFFFLIIIIYKIISLKVGSYSCFQ